MIPLLALLLQTLPSSSLAAHEDATARLAWTPEGKLLLTRGDGTLKIWIASTRRLLHAIPAPGDDLALSPDGAWAATEGAIWAVATGLRRAGFDAGRVLAMGWSADSRTLVTATLISGGLQVRSWTLDGAEAAAFAIPTPGDARAVAVAGNRLAFGAPDLSVRVWDVADRRPIATLEGPGDRLTDLLVDGPRVAAACADGQVRFWTDGRLVRALEGGGPIAWSGDRAVVRGADGLELWDLGAGTRQAVFAGPGTGVWSPACVAFPPGGRLAAGGTLIAKVAAPGRRVSGPVYVWK
ncbi:MAG TPA: hypothetical protein VEJ18_06290 [Planctomycetota bacterium]|nr:hypothetical protein [Planctomycetota bacterium]